jgi:hypothetical protein
MPAVTQTTPNFLGGVSRQNDDKKLVNQVTECKNGYPDPTYGLLKRPGMEHINVLRKADGTPFTEFELAGAFWFFIDAAGSFVGAIKGSDIYVWTKDIGEFCTVTNNGASYLGAIGSNKYHFRSVQDVTIITNKESVARMQANNTFVAKSQATLKLLSLLENDEFSVTIQNETVTVTAQNNTTFDDMLLYKTTPSSEIQNTHHLIDGIINLITTQQAANNADFDGRWYIEGHNNSINIRRTNEADGVVTDYSTPGGTPLAFDIDARGGLSNVALEVFEDEVDSADKLPQESFNGHTVKVVNTNSAEDDYYLKFVSTNTSTNYGRGYWQETRARDVSPGLDASTMPHELVNTGSNTFTFGPVSWKARETGDDNSSPIPSFIDKKISATFFYNNRFGVLSEDNVFFGTANNSFNFFVKSGLTQVDSDPIDLNVSSVRHVALTDVLPSPQGLLLFSARQQFQVYSSSTTTLTPKTAVIRTVSNYEMDPKVTPVDVGTTAAFINKVPGYSKLFTLQLRDVEQSPTVVDISKVVLEWIPDSIDFLSVSPQNSVIMLVDKNLPYMYLYRYYNNGEEDLFQAWVKWEIPTTIQAVEIIDDDVIIVSQHEDEYTLSKIVLDQIPTGEVVLGSIEARGNPTLDMATRPVSPAPGVSSVVYDPIKDTTRIYVPYTPIIGRPGTMILGVSVEALYDSNGEPIVITKEQEAGANAGYYAIAEGGVEANTNYNYFDVKGDFTNYVLGIIVGYGYDFEVTLPKFYYRPKPAETDFTATLTISRVKFSVGRTGAIRFKIKADGSNEWKNVEPTIDANRYPANTTPVKSERQFIVPIHQRNTNFELKVTSDLPFPVSLVAMMWEGVYSPRFYRRA